MSQAATRFVGDGLRLSDGSILPVVSAELHYWRLDKNSWRGALEGLQTMGIRIVSTCVPWSVHQPKGAGPKDFDQRGDKDLSNFLGLVHELGMHAMLRPGPHNNAELTKFGFPRRVLENEACLAKTSQGTPLWLPAPPKMFPVPSYASKAFQEEVRAWYASVAEVVRPYLHPAGPVVAIQVDSEMQMFYRLGAFDGDYHPDALSWWKEFSGGEPPPRRYEHGNMSDCLQWLRFKEEYISHSLQWLHEALVEVGLGTVAHYHNAPPSNPALATLPSAAQAIDGECGMDVRNLARDHDRVRHRSIYVSSSCTLPFAPELAIGGPPWLPPMTDHDQQKVTLGALAGGIRAFNLYMGVERERWYGGLLREDGKATRSGQWVAPLLACLERNRFHELRRKSEVSVVLSRAEARAAIASCAVDGATPVLTELLGLGPGGHAELSMDDDARLYPRWFRAVVEALDLAEIPYRLVDENSLHRIGPETRALILPTLRRIDAGTWAAVHAMADAGLRVIIGPRIPREDEYGMELPAEYGKPAKAGVLEEAVLGDPDGLADAFLSAVGELEDLWISPENPQVHSSVFEDSDGVARLLFVGNRSRDPQEAALNVLPNCTLVDPLVPEDRAQFPSDEEGVVTIPLEEYGVRLFEIREG